MSPWDKSQNIFLTLFIQKSKKKRVEFFRYFFVSIASLLTDFSFLYILTSFFNLHYLISAAISYTVGIFVNYFLSVKWVFSKKSLNSRPMEFTVFALIGVIGLGVNEILMWFFTSVLMQHFMISRVISAGVGYIWKYLARKYFLFR